MHVLVVEDDAMMAATLAKGIAEDGYRVTTCATAGEALQQIAADDPVDLASLDIGLPDRSGLDVLRVLRAQKRHVPVILLTARDTVRDRVKGLDAGADDYIVKPFAFAELLARIRARLRQPDVAKPTTLQAGDLTIDVLNRRAARGPRELLLTSQEFALLQYLVANAGKTVSRDMIARDVWHVASRATPLDNVIAVHISHLRAKVDKGFDRELIQTVWGVGFSLKVDA